MNQIFATAALALAVTSTTITPSYAQGNVPAGDMMGMPGGGCPMMGMMGQGLMGPSMMGPGMMRRGMMPGNEEELGAIAESRLANLKTELKIADAQADVWNSYADAIKARVDAMQSMRMGMMNAMQRGGAIERMEIRIKGMEAMVEAMKAVKPATENLYAALTRDQKKIADRLIGIDCGAM